MFRSVGAFFRRGLACIRGANRSGAGVFGQDGDSDPLVSCLSSF